MTAPEGTKPKNFVLTPHDLGRVENCPASALFVPTVKAKPHPAMWWGIGIHKFLEYAKTHDRDYALAYMRKKFPRMADHCAKLPVEQIPDGQTEVAFLINTQQRSAFVGHYTDAIHDEHFYAKSDLVFAEPLKASWSAGASASASLLASPVRLPTGTPVTWIMDYKSGEAPGVTPETSIQIRTLCAAKWLIDDKPAYIGGSILPLKTFQRRDWVFTGYQMEVHLDYVRLVHLIVQETRSEYRQEGVEPEYVEGPWCTYCDIREQCPKKQAQVVIDHSKELYEKRSDSK